jgi:hypothetical protein
MASDKDKAIARQGRIAALVVAGAMLIWLIAQWAGPQLGLAGRYALLIDFAAMAAFVWAFVVALQIWRARRDEE